MDPIQIPWIYGSESRIIRKVQETVNTNRMGISTWLSLQQCQIEETMAPETSRPPQEREIPDCGRRDGPIP
jgi:hypothetical protein